MTVFVEAEDSVAAVDAAGDLWANVPAVHELAALDDGTVKIRPARAGEGPLQTSAPNQEPE